MMKTLLCLLVSLSAMAERDIFKISEKYLNEKISTEEMSEMLKLWNQSGWSEEERLLLRDVLSKRKIDDPITCVFFQPDDCSEQVLEAQTQASEFKDFPIEKPPSEKKKSFIESHYGKILVVIGFGFFALQQSGKKVVIDSNPFN